MITFTACCFPHLLANGFSKVFGWIRRRKIRFLTVGDFLVDTGYAACDVN